MEIYNLSNHRLVIKVIMSYKHRLVIKVIMSYKQTIASLETKNIFYVEILLTQSEYHRQIFGIRKLSI